MNNIEFENLQYQNEDPLQNRSWSITNWLQKNGLAGNEKQAFFILLGFVVCALLASIFILYSALTTKQTEKLTPAQVQAILDKTKNPPPN